MRIEGFADVTEILRGGVYVLAYRGEVIYVGKAKRMLNRLAAHLSVWAAKRKERVPSWLPIRGIYYDAAYIRPCHPDDIDRLEREMIELYKPRHNTKLITPGPTKAPFSIEVNGLKVAFNTPKPTYPLIERRI